MLVTAPRAPWVPGTRQTCPLFRAPARRHASAKPTASPLTTDEQELVEVRWRASSSLPLGLSWRCRPLSIRNPRQHEGTKMAKKKDKFDVKSMRDQAAISPSVALGLCQ